MAIVAICDVNQTAIHRGYRWLLENRGVDAVVITTPERWHAIMCIGACDAGKAVYVEKPAAHFIRVRRR